MWSLVSSYYWHSSHLLSVFVFSLFVGSCLVYSTWSCATNISLSFSTFRCPFDSHRKISSSLISCPSTLLIYWPCNALFFHLFFKNFHNLAFLCFILLSSSTSLLSSLSSSSSLSSVLYEVLLTFFYQIKQYVSRGKRSSLIVMRESCFCTCLEVTWRSGGTADHSFSLNPRWRSVVSSILQLLYSQRKIPSSHWIEGWLCPRAGLDVSEKQKILHLPRI
jgi:hypothetical protein